MFCNNGMVPAVRLGLATALRREPAVASLITEGEVYVMSDETKQRVGFVLTFNRCAWSRPVAAGRGLGLGGF